MTATDAPTTNTGQTTAQKTQAALAASPGATAVEIAARASLGRSTVTRHLAALERAGLAHRAPGTQPGTGRNPDRWTQVIPVRKLEPVHDGRLRPGQLDDLVLTFFGQADSTISYSAGEVARNLDRSAGAVANCLVRLAESKRLRETEQRPRRYSAN